MDAKHKRYLKLNLISLFFVAVSFISVTLAWFAYTGFASSGLDVDIKAWHIEFNGESKASNEIIIPLTNIYPGMDTVVESVNIKNKGDSEAKLSYTIDSVRILDEELDMTLDQRELVDMLSNKYPFNIDISLSKEYIDANIGEATIDLSVSWPLDSDNDKDDSLWGNKTYEFQENERKLKGKDSSYNPRSSIKVVISLIAEQNMDKFTLNTGNMVLYNPVENDRCDSIGGTCYKTNMITPYYNDEDNVMLLPNILNDYASGSYDEFEGKIEDITRSWTSDHSSFELRDLMSIVGNDVHNTILVRENLSDSIVGYITHDNRFDDYMNSRVLPKENKDYNSYIKFNSVLFDYLNTNKCIWLNYEYNDNMGFAMKKMSDGIMKIYPEDKSTSCDIIPLISVPRTKLYNK